MTIFCKGLNPKKYFGATLILALIHVVLYVYFISGRKNELEFSQSIASEQQTMNRIDPSDIPENGIYFLETSGLPFLNPKQLCAVESAALHHPNRPVVVAIKNEFLQLPSVVKYWSEKYPNIMFTQIDIVQWLNGTILQSWSSKNLLAKSEYKTVHTSDVLRYATLFKFGGLYLDIDVIVMRSMDDLVNAVGLQHPISIANGVMAFEKHHPIMEECLKAVSEGFDPYKWASNGPELLTRVICTYCGWNSTELPKPGDCEAVRILDIDAFYPVEYPLWDLLFNPDQNISTSILKHVEQSYLLHFWSDLSVDQTIDVGSSQALGVLAAKNCPQVSASMPNGLLWGFDFRSISKS